MLCLPLPIIQIAAIDVKETYCVSVSMPKSDDSIGRGMFNQSR